MSSKLFPMAFVGIVFDIRRFEGKLVLHGEMPTPNFSRGISDYIDQKLFIYHFHLELHKSKQVSKS